MGMLLAVYYDKQAMIPGVYDAIKELFHNPSEPFYTGSVMDLLYDGVEIDCTSQNEMTSQALCTQFSIGAQKAIRMIDDKHFAFSLFGGVSVQLFFCFRQTKQIIVFIRKGKWHRSWPIHGLSR